MIYLAAYILAGLLCTAYTLKRPEARELISELAISLNARYHTVLCAMIIVSSIMWPITLLKKLFKKSN